MVSVQHGSPRALSFLMAEIYFFFHLVNYLFHERCSLGDTEAILEFRPVPPNRTGQNEKTEMLKQFWFLITSEKVKSETHEGCLEKEQMERSSLVKPSSRWEMWTHFCVSLLQPLMWKTVIHIAAQILNQVLSRPVAVAGCLSFACYHANTCMHVRREDPAWFYNRL